MSKRESLAIISKEILFGDVNEEELGLIPKRQSLLSEEDFEGRVLLTKEEIEVKWSSH